jgi:ABC-type uncharacterized transport system substrate-binding protein
MNLNIKNTTILSTLLTLLFFATPVFSHSYHYELQVTNTLQTNDKKQLEALQLSFLYDGDVSDVMLQDEKDLNKLAEKLTSDLATLGYFTQIKLNGKVLNTQKASKVKLEKITSKGKDGNFDVLKLNFTLALKSPVTLGNNSKLAFFHEDPTAAAILYYESANKIILGDNLKSSCNASVKEKGKFKEGEFPQIIKVNCK